MNAGTAPSGFRPVAVTPNATFRASSLSLVTRSGTSITSVCETSSGSFGSTLNGWRASMVLATAPTRPSSVCPATSTW